MSNYPSLDSLESRLSDPRQSPRSLRELSAEIESALAAPSTDSGLVYVPDPEAPVTPDTRDEQVIAPSARLEPEVRALSVRNKALSAKLLSLVTEVQNSGQGLQSLLSQAGAKMAAVRSYLSAPDGRWMRFTDRFLDYSKIDGAQTRGVSIDTASHGGVTINPSGETDLTPLVTLSLIRSPGIPGDNLEIIALQDLPSQMSPSQGSTDALAIAKQGAASGGSGKEPTVTFATGSDSHNQITTVLSDQSDLYFDWERVYVPPRQKCSLHGTAYVYDSRSGSTVDVKSVTQGYGWTASIDLGDGTKTSSPLAYFQDPPVSGRDGAMSALTLQIQGDLGSLQPMNQLEIDVRQVESLWPTITSVTVSADGSQWYQLRCEAGSTVWTGDASPVAGTNTTPGTTGAVSVPATGQSVVGSSLWNVPTLNGAEPDNAGIPELRYFNITLTQSQAYACPKGIGHPFYVEVTEEKKSSSSWFGLSHSSSDTTTVQRLPSPDQIVSVSPGVVSQSSSQGSKLLSGAGQVLDNPGLRANPTLTLVGAGLQVLGSLWGSSKDTKSVLQAGEYVDVFQGFRQCISLRRIKPVSRVYPTTSPGQLVSRQYTFAQRFTAVRLLTDDSVPSGTSLSYDVSFDGQTWQTITPTDLGLPPAPTITPGTVVTTDSPQTSVWVRGTLSTTDPSKSCRWLGYTIEALPYLG